MKELGIGVTTWVGIGGDPINGSSFLDISSSSSRIRTPRRCMMIGEIGGPQEAEASAWIRRT